MWSSNRGWLDAACCSTAGQQKHRLSKTMALLASTLKRPPCLHRRTGANYARHRTAFCEKYGICGSFLFPCASSCYLSGCQRAAGRGGATDYCCLGHREGPLSQMGQDLQAHDHSLASVKTLNLIWGISLGVGRHHRSQCDRRQCAHGEGGEGLRQGYGRGAEHDHSQPHLVHLKIYSPVAVI